jgi:methyltransferase-like protein/ubiquinone/menaquinone biosynthesis C-methylase UbiE
MPTATPTNRYDSVLYPSYTHPQTHPNRLAVIGTLMGLKPASPTRCRLLEIGCGDASNLMPMAWTLPESEFVGVDLAAKPIAKGKEISEALGLRNIRLIQGDLNEINGDWGKFDYIIAHGLYSWVPKEVREHLLELCRMLLTPDGVALVSYNALPGGHMRNMLREMMLFHVRGFESPQERIEQARALIRFLAEWQTPSDEYRAWIKAEFERALEHQPGYLYHDHLGEINEPCYFTQFIERAAAHGLQYLAEADYFEMSDHAFAAPVRQTLSQLAGNRIQREQYLDFLKCRRFRQTLLCHGEARLKVEPDPEHVTPFAVVCPARRTSDESGLQPGVTCAFQAPNGARCATDFALGKAALSVLGPLCPTGLSFDETLARSLQLLKDNGVNCSEDVDARAQLAQFLLRVYSVGLVDFRATQPAVATRVSDKPVASALARWQIQRGNTVTSLYHLAVQVEDEVGKNLLCWLDGTADRESLRERLWNFLNDKKAVTIVDGDIAGARKKVEAELETNLEKLARMGLLVS